MQSRLQSAVAPQPEKQLAGPSMRQTPVRQSRSVFAVHRSPAPPTAVEALGVKRQSGRMTACAGSAIKAGGVQYRSCTVVEGTAEPQVPTPLAGVSVTQAEPQ